MNSSKPPGMIQLQMPSCRFTLARWGSEPYLAQAIVKVPQKPAFPKHVLGFCAKYNLLSQMSLQALVREIFFSVIWLWYSCMSLCLQLLFRKKEIISFHQTSLCSKVSVSIHETRSLKALQGMWLDGCVYPRNFEGGRIWSVWPLRNGSKQVNGGGVRQTVLHRALGEDCHYSRVWGYIYGHVDLS